MNSTAYAKRTQYKPIDFFFRGVVDAKTKNKKVAFIDVFQILNDRYLGRMSVCNYFVIAENSVRINELNIIALEELKNYDLVMRENFLIPDNIIYSVPISVRFLENEKDFEILVSALKDCKYKKTAIILSFFGNTLVRLDAEGKKRYNYLRRLGYKTCAAAFGEDYNSLDIFSALNFDYLRCEAQYFDSSQSKKKVLSMLIKFCAANKIALIMEGVDSPAQYARFKREGVKYLTGRAVSKLTRWINNEYLKLPEPTGEKKEAYLAKLQVELTAKQKAELAELQALREEAMARAMEENGGGIMPVAARPELAKSPYQVRLEQQRNNARKIVLDLMESESRVIEQEEVSKDANFAGEMNRLRFEGDVQSALALSFAYEKKSELGVQKTTDEGLNMHKKGRKLKMVLTAEESGVNAPMRPVDSEGNVAPTKVKKKKNVKADLKKQEKLLNEYRKGDKLGGLGMETGMLGFGVTMRVESENKDEPDLVGHYNNDGQWVDTDGNTYNGYFDKEGKWIEYEQFDREKEGHYNENAQWVDADGNVYDGYFDEEGRWIDYTYTDSRGEIVDNGYFDDKIGKWVPFGYFDADGNYHKI